MKLEKMHDEGITFPITLAEVVEELRDETQRMALIGSMAPRRAGTHIFSVVLEHTLYPPLKKELSDLFNIYTFEWPDETMCHAVITFPVNDKELVFALAARCGLAPKLGSPALLISGTGPGTGWFHFPVKGDNVYTLENVPNHPAYDSALNQETLQRENDILGYVFGGDDPSKIGNRLVDALEAWEAFLSEKSTVSF